MLPRRVAITALLLLCCLSVFASSLRKVYYDCECHECIPVDDSIIACQFDGPSLKCKDVAQDKVTTKAEFCASRCGHELINLDAQGDEINGDFDYSCKLKEELEVRVLAHFKSDEDILRRVLDCTRSFKSTSGHLVYGKIPTKLKRAAKAYDKKALVSDDVREEREQFIHISSPDDDYSLPVLTRVLKALPSPRFVAYCDFADRHSVSYLTVNARFEPTQVKKKSWTTKLKEKSTKLKQKMKQRVEEWLYYE